MRAVVVVAHPGAGSLCAALAGAAGRGLRGAGAEVVVQDLYADGFDPRMPLAEVGTTDLTDPLVRRYAEEVLAADAIAIVHPVWFFHAPAILKGWVERVLREGIAYRLGSGGQEAGLLGARRALVINTANAPEAVEAGLYGDPLDTFWRRIVFGPAGVSDVRRLRFAKVAGSELAARAGWIAEAERAAAELIGEG